MEGRRTHQTVVKRRREVLEVKPDVERSLRRDVHFQSKLFETLEDVVAFVLEVLLQGQPLLTDVFRVEERDRSQLQSACAKTDNDVSEWNKA